MASIFLSYDHDDAARAAPIAAALEAHGHSVWWDRHIHGGAEYNDLIESAVATSDAVVVLWSANSVRSPWVRDEASEGRDRGRLVPVLIEPVKPPMGFRQYQTIDLANWKGGKRIPRLSEVLDAIDKVAPAPAIAAEAGAPKSPPRQSTAAARETRGVSRRLLIGGGAALCVVGVGGAAWWAQGHEDPRFKALMDQAHDQMLKEAFDEKTARLLEQAIAIRPNSAQAWGLLGLLKSLVAQDAESKDAGRLVDEAEKATRHALSLDPKQPDALLAMFELEGSTLDWITRDRRLRQVLAIDPNHVEAIAELVLLTQATGLNRESWDWNERALALDPLNADFLAKRALKHWIAGRTGDSDKVVDQTRALYPGNRWVWFVRFLLYALTGRPQAALAMLDADPDHPPPMVRLWRASLPAMEQPSTAAVTKARNACIEAAQISPELVNQAVQIMCVLGDVDTAFDIANGALLSRGPIVSKSQLGTGNAMSNAGWRVSTQWMWTPPTARMRADPRFLPLCEGIGLTDYWQKRGVKPDYQRVGR